MLSPAGKGGVSLKLRAEYGRREHANRQDKLKIKFPEFNGEYLLSHSFEYNGYEIIVRGRPDAVYNQAGQLVVEEIKTVAADPVSFGAYKLEDFPGFRLQLDLYCYLISIDENSDVIGRLCLVNLTEGKERIVDYHPSFGEIESALEKLFIRLTVEAENQRHHREGLANSAGKLEFPYPDIRPNQDKMFQSVSNTVQAGGRLMLSAPTGSGKTAGVLYPALLESFNLGKKIFFATARTTQRHIVRELVDLMKTEGSIFSALFLTARAKLCPIGEELCTWTECEYLADFEGKYNRTTLIKEMDEGAVFTGEDISERVAHLRLCPFAVSLLLAERADLIVGDFNYVFDPSASLRNLFDEGGAGDFILIIDEAHNLPNRIRERFSPQLDEQQIWEILFSLRGKSYNDELYGEIGTFIRQIMKMISRIRAMENPSLDLEVVGQLHTGADRLAMLYYLHLAKYSVELRDDPILAFLREFAWFCKVAEMGAEGFALHYDETRRTLKNHCLDSRIPLIDKIEEFHSVIAMSATLLPNEFFRHSLGFVEDVEFVNLPNPFPAENRLITIAANVSTKFNIREKFHEQIAGIIDEVYDSHPGNYLCFFPSFKYMMDVESNIKNPHIEQESSMSESEREEFISKVMNGDKDNIYLAVMGGIFAEGVDFPGRLDGIIVIGPGLPLYCVETELQKRYFDEQFEAGFQYAFAYPGMNRVVQASGRLIRSENDRGVIVLVGSRFSQPPYNRLIPRDWYIEHPSELITRNLKSTLQRFWDKAY